MLIGHDHLIRAFKTLADEDRLGHGYLFFGPPRVGKKMFALSLARYLENGVFDVPGHVPLGDVTVVAPGPEVEFGIDRIREAKDFLFSRPNRSKQRTLIVDEAEKLTGEAMNAFLKLAEEPPRSALVLVVTNDPDALPSTLRSRLASIHFGTVGSGLIAELLEREYAVKNPLAANLARRSFGAPGLAVSLATDAAFQEYVALAEAFFDAPARDRGQRIKDMTAEENFDFAGFLEALLMQAAWKRGRYMGLWHEIGALKRDASRFNLSPRLQLSALAEHIQ